MRANKDVLLVEPCPDLLCGLCHDVLDEPLQIRCPEDHIFCTKCITEFTMQNAQCPTCQVPIDTTLFQPSKFVKRQIGRLRARCPYKRYGCKWEGLFADDHVLHCQHQFTKCANADRGCPECLRRTNVQRHQEECPFALISCPNGRPGCSSFLRKDQETHERECRSFPCKYQSSGCTFIGTLPESRAHSDAYCEKIHSKLAHLEAECKRLSQLLAEKNSQQDNINNALSLPTSLPPVSAPMSDLDIFQLLNGTTPFPLDLKGTNSSLLDQDFMKFGPTDITFGSTPSATTLAPYSPVTPVMTSTPQVPATNTGSAPKRSSNGKRIRYSKNVRLAHNALRLARQQDKTIDPLESALREFGFDGLTMDGDIPMATPTVAPAPAIPNNNESAAELVNLLKQQSISSPPQDNFGFDNLDEMAKFMDSLPTSLNDDLPGSTLIPLTTPTSMPSPPPAESNAVRSQTTSAAAKTSPLPSTPPQTTSSTAAPTPSNADVQEEARSPHGSTNDTSSQPGAPKKRPMFVLASSYLSNYK